MKKLAFLLILALLVLVPAPAPAATVLVDSVGNQFVLGAFGQPVFVGTSNAAFSSFNFAQTGGYGAGCGMRRAAFASARVGTNNTVIVNNVNAVPQQASLAVAQAQAGRRGRAQSFAASGAGGVSFAQSQTQRRGLFGRRSITTSTAFSAGSGGASFAQAQGGRRR